MNLDSNDISSFEYQNFELQDTYLEQSEHVISQKEKISIEPITFKAPDGWYFSDTGEISQTRDSYYKNDEYTEPGGYVTLITTAYQIGIFDGNIVYHITSHADINKDFFFDKKDNLIIRTAENAAYYDGKNCSGKSTVYNLKGGNHDYLYETKLTPQFSRGPGVLYEFDVIQDGGLGDTYLPRQTTVDGDYYIVATNTTEVQSSYVHNQNIFADSLSFTFGPVGINIPLDWFNAAIYYATPLTLPGYDDVIQRTLHTINQEDYGFEEQYFFYSKTKQHTINGLNFTTTRLRCGYIEEEYINLSANRKNAGTAYLEYKFEELIFSLSTYLTFWSSNEQFKSSDVAYIEYLDNDNNWIKCFDMFNDYNPLPTNRDNPKRYELNFIEGTKGIRFYSHTDDPQSEKNKGRICIGKTTFTTYNFYV